MQVTWKKEEKQLVVTMEGKAWKDAQEKAFKKLAKNQSIPGFRKGHAPEAMVRKHISSQAILMEALNDSLQEMYTTGLEDSKIQPITQPEVDIESLTEETISVIFKVEPQPEVKLDPKYKDLKVEVKQTRISKKELETEIDRLREEAAEWVLKEEGEVKEGDKIVLDYEGFKGEEAFEGGKSENAELEIGSNTFIPGFEEQLVGVKAGESKDLNLTFPEDYPSEELKGAEVVFKTTVHEIREKQLPELNEEFVASLNEEGVTTVEEFEAAVKDRLTKQKEEANLNEAQDKVMSDLMELAEVEIPEVMIENESKQLLQEFMQRLQSQGINYEMYKTILNQTDEDVMGQIKPDAEKRVLYRLVMNEVANQENIEVSEDDIENEYKTISETYGIDIQEVKKLAAKEDIAFDVKLKKAVDLVLSR